MLRFIVFILFLFLPCTLFLGGKSSDSTPDSAERAAASDVEAYASLYRSMQLEGVVNWKAFRQAVAGYYKIDNRKREVLTLIDFSRPSTAKRLFVFDMRERKVLFSSVVCHFLLQRIWFLQKFTGVLSYRIYLPGKEWVFAYFEWFGKRNQ